MPEDAVPRTERHTDASTWRTQCRGQALPIPPTWQLLAVVLVTLLVVAGLTAIPARIGVRRSPAEILQSELA